MFCIVSAAIQYDAHYQESSLYVGAVLVRRKNAVSSNVSVWECVQVVGGGRYGAPKRSVLGATGGGSPEVYESFGFPPW